MNRRPFLKAIAALLLFPFARTATAKPKERIRLIDAVGRTNSKEFMRQPPGTIIFRGIGLGIVSRKPQYEFELFCVTDEKGMVMNPLPPGFPEIDMNEVDFCVPENFSPYPWWIIGGTENGIQG